MVTFGVVVSAIASLSVGVFAENASNCAPITALLNSLPNVSAFDGHDVLLPTLRRRF